MYSGEQYYVQMNKVILGAGHTVSFRPRKSRFFGKLKDLTPRLRGLLKRRKVVEQAVQMELPLSD
jgi:hypothetical protein